MSEGPGAPGGSAPAEDLRPTAGWVAREVEQELPGLAMLSVRVRCGRPLPLTGDSPPDVIERLRVLSSRFRGARAVGIRNEPITAAYRVFFRQIGMDPDEQRTPIEAAVLERMLRGGFPTGGLIEDVLLIALLDTGVALWALDAETLEGPLGIRASSEMELLGDPVQRGVRAGAGSPITPGTLVVADAAGPVAVLFGEVAPAHRPAARTHEVEVFAVTVPGVPSLYAEEALWSAAQALG